MTTEQQQARQRARSIYRTAVIRMRKLKGTVADVEAGQVPVGTAEKAYNDAATMRLDLPEALGPFEGDYQRGLVLLERARVAYHLRLRAAGVEV